MRKVVCVFLLGLIPMFASAALVDTTIELNRIVKCLKGLRNCGYDYAMNVEFPNGEKDRLKGFVFVGGDEGMYLNDCSAFLMIYTPHFFYNADHRKKQLTVVELDEKKYKTVQQSIGKDILRNGAVTAFLDSIVIRKARVRQLIHEGSRLRMTLEFPQTENVKAINIVFNTDTNLPEEYQMTVSYPWQATRKGIQSIETTIKCTGFTSKIDREKYDKENLFSTADGKLNPRKYNNYKLIQKM